MRVRVWVELTASDNNQIRCGLRTGAVRRFPGRDHPFMDVTDLPFPTVTAGRPPRP